MPSKNISELTHVNEELKREIAERKRAEAELEQRTKLLSTLLDVSNLVSSTLELKPLLEAILDRLKSIIEYENAKLFVIDDEIMRIIAHRSRISSEEEKEYTSLYRRVLMEMEITERKEPVVIDDLHGSTQNARIFRKQMSIFMEKYFSEVHSWMGIPLIIKDKVIGILTMDHRKPGYYLPHHVELGMAFASQAAIEFENARLYSQTMNRADAMKTMFSVQQAITSRLDLDGVMKLIADEARRLTGSERTALYLVMA